MRSSFVAACLLFLASLAAHRCQDDETATPRPEVVWDGARYVAMWRSGSTIHVQRDRVRSVYSNRKLHGEPTISATSSGFLLVASRDPDSAGDYRKAITVPLGRDGRVSARPIEHPSIITSADRQCRARLAVGGRAASGFLFDPREGEAYFLDFTTFDDRGISLTSSLRITLSYPMDCALASRGEDLVSAVRFANSIEIEFHDLRDLAHDTHSFSIPDVGGTKPWELAVIASGEERWAILYRDRADTLRVALFDRHGMLESYALPAAVDGETADIGVTDRGVFVTWLAGGRLHVQGVAGGADHTVRAPRHAGIRATGHGDECAVALRGPGANRIEIERFARCP